jgi:hypothetical protein
VGLLDSLRRLFGSTGSSSMRDRYRDREAGTDPKFGTPTPTGSVGPSGDAMEEAQGEGGAIEPDPRGDS